MTLGKRMVAEDMPNLPFPEMVKGMGVAVAEAQFELDWVGIRLARMMSGGFGDGGNGVGEAEFVTREAYLTFNGKKMSLLELGFSPAFRCH